jgi:nicotinamidase/pyrazinamidase
MKTVFFDIDTQLDFLVPAGALYVPGAEWLVPLVARLNHSASTVVSTTDAHLESDPEFRDWPPHCVLDCLGQNKPAATLREQRVVIPADAAEIRLAPQIIFRKRVLDVFASPNLPALLEALAADAYVVYGVVTEICVEYAVRGLVKTGKPVTLVTDAIKELHDAAGRRTISDFAASGGTLATVSELCG